MSRRRGCPLSSSTTGLSRLSNLAATRALALSAASSEGLVLKSSLLEPQQTAAQPRTSDWFPIFVNDSNIFAEAGISTQPKGFHTRFLT